MTTTNYDERSIDYYILGDTPIIFNGGPAEADLSLDIENGGQICTGFLKQIQKAIVLLLTYMYYYGDPEWSTELPRVLNAQSLSVATRAFRTLFFTGADSVVNNLQSEQNMFTPYDEIITRIILEDLEADFDAGTLKASCSIHNAAGTSAQLVLPIRKL